MPNTAGMDTNNTQPLAQLVGDHARGDYLNQREAAAYLGCTSEWLRRLRHAGEGPASVEVGRQRRYAVATLDAWMAKRHKAVKS